MAEAHKNTHKNYNDYVGKEKRRITKQKQAVEIEVKPTNITYDNCCYCFKGFCNTRFLVKHILRRHCDKVMELHKNALTLTNSGNTCLSSQDLFQFLKTEFTDLKVEVENLKKVITNKETHKSLETKPTKNMNHSIPDDTNNVKSDSAKFEISKTNANFNAVQVSLTDFQSVQAQINELFQMFGEIIASRDNMEKSMKKNSAEYEEYFRSMKGEIRRLEKLVELNSKKINSQDGLPEIQKYFEERIQNLLASNSLFFSNRGNKIDQNRISNHRNKHSQNRKKKSIYTSNSPCLTKCDALDTNKNEGSHLIIDRRKKHENTLNVDKDPHSLLIQDADKNEDTYSLFVLGNPHLEKQCGKIYEFNSLVENSENFTEDHLNKAKLLVEEKLKCLAIDPNTNKLSCEDYDKKMCVVNSEKIILNKKYKTFYDMHDKVDSYVNEVVKSKLEKTNPKKIRFSDESSLSPIKPDCGLSPKIHSAQKQESSGFLFSSEMHSQDNSTVNKNLDLENLAPIQEADECVSEELHADYHYKRTADSLSDCKYSKEFSPNTLYEFATDGTSADKKSNFSMSQKTVEEISDLSSLESEILE
ncbi:c2H2-type domain-containing protein [Caerostris extrusa]|uniref:C2H2-type domain-containing protein n=1 Tax=Caerostris extrusa TaxID=172846 RepID=A0AAV4NRF7_CAEEX|nr:c2H2-type domain-containing protein [Caerostris extrusa]